MFLQGEHSKLLLIFTLCLEEIITSYNISQVESKCNKTFYNITRINNAENP